MTTNGSTWKAAARRAAQRAKQAAMKAAKEADRLIRLARQRAKTSGAERRVKQALASTARVLKAAGTAAIKAGVAAAKQNTKPRKKRRSRG
jgi:hypothetical protein